MDNFLNSYPNKQALLDWDKAQLVAFLDFLKNIKEFPIYQIVDINNVIEGLKLTKTSYDFLRSHLADKQGYIRLIKSISK